MKDLVVLEPTATGFAAFSPDLPGCIATGATREEAEHEIAEAIAFHLDGLRAEGLPVFRITPNDGHQRAVDDGFGKEA